jgi:hypothetical protein
MSFSDFYSTTLSTDLQNVASHWSQARGMRSMPAWHDLHPSQIAAQLPIMWVYRYERESDRFIGRLAGDQIERVFGRSFRGTPMAELYPEQDYSRLFERAKRVVCQPAFYRGEGMVFRHMDHYGRGERIMLPIAEDGTSGDGVLGATVYESLRGAPAEPAIETESWFAL